MQYVYIKPKRENNNQAVLLQIHNTVLFLMTQLGEIEIISAKRVFRKTKCIPSHTFMLQVEPFINRCYFILISLSKTT